MPDPLPEPAPRDWFDTSIPLVIVKVGHYPMHHGGLFLARSAGRVGIRVIAMVEGRWTPLASSRYVTSRLATLPLEVTEDQLIDVFAPLADELGCRPVVATTDDEGAVILDEFAHALAPFVRLPRQRPGMSRWVSSKKGLLEACAQAGVAAPRTQSPATAQDVREFARTAVFPVVVKNRDSFKRRTAPGVEGTTVMETPEQLLTFAQGYDDHAPVILQEFVPAQHRVNCIYQGYRSSRSDDVVSFTGVKIRDWPIGRGETTLSRSVTDSRLKAWGDGLLTSLDYRGVCGLDVLLDRRDDTYKLIDFNPRFGANCATFYTDSGLDLVRAYHLDLTDRELPLGRQVDDVLFQVETNDAKSLADGHPTREPERGTVLAYRAADDPTPGRIASLRRRGSQVKDWGRRS